jgi:hypothetical protein
MSGIHFIAPNRNFAATNRKKILLVATRRRDQWNFFCTVHSKQRATKMFCFGLRGEGNLLSAVMQTDKTGETYWTEGVLLEATSVHEGYCYHS